MPRVFRIYNTLTRRKEDFEPLNPPRVTMYVCGITAYDEAHLGHARAAVIFDVLYRFLQYLGYQVTYVRNYTDIDDKIINRAFREGRPWYEIAEQYIREYQEETAALGVRPPTYEPRATEHIPEMIALVKKLLARGVAYVVDGEVYFAVEKFPGYGKLSGRRLEDMLAGARVEVSEKKRNPLDFALWKAAKPGEPFWESPWGPGRPGWHLECSAMSLKYCGETLDLHGGGLDLIFPHHENEIAQSEAATGKPFVRYFVHNGLITVNGEKMAKSLGNYVSLKSLLSRYHPEVIRLFLLTKHYRSPLDYTEQALSEAEKALYGLYGSLYFLKKAEPVEEGGLRKAARRLAEALSRFREEFVAALADDLNTAEAIGALFRLLSEVNRFLPGARRATGEEVRLAEEVLATVRDLSGEILGLGGSEPEDFVEKERRRKLELKGLDPREVEERLSAREEARRAKDFARADALREELLALGVEVRDTPWGPFWMVL
ncbi:cysteine--tRNA ligase [Thermosulfurimonas marina]|uniref:Cysteine--tRNA ligase n=1 Tax=Thermosulfurimonas marina TaxID=2047767 RepID=A0A6H1WRC6_9BACT|nr:cysteine--tRNA ligase [Thermosulfurimonas marina]QJA05710.1 cysteine--tRNA ligase [Thermosulfurimonas marina]